MFRHVDPLRTRSLSLAILLVLSSINATRGDATGLSATIETTRAVYFAGDTLNIRVIVRNQSSAPLWLYRWQFPLAGEFEHNLFSVVHDNRPVRYLGKTVKRGPPSAENDLRLDPGEVFEQLIDLESGYEITAAGDYRLEFRQPGPTIRYGTAEGSASFLDALPGVTFQLADARTRPKQAVSRALGSSTCSGPQLATINQALADARAIAQTARDDLAEAPLLTRYDAPRYREWFGGYNASRYATVSANFDSIFSYLDTATLSFDCSCDQDFYAYVFTDSPGTIYLCNLFWLANPLGTDSRAGTLVHEVSHFNIVAGTADYAYGQANCRNLADTSPELAITNADSHEYFAENTPCLSMPLASDADEPACLPDAGDFLLEIIPAIIRGAAVQ